MPDFVKCRFLGPIPHLLGMKPGTLNFNKGPSCLRVSQLHPRMYCGSLLPDAEFSRLCEVYTDKTTYSGVATLKWGLGSAEGLPKWREL